MEYKVVVEGVEYKVKEYQACEEFGGSTVVQVMGEYVWTTFMIMQSGNPGKGRVRAAIKKHLKA